MIGRIVTGSGETRKAHFLPVCRHERRDIGLILKKSIFPGASYRTEKARGERSLAGGVN